MMFHLVSKAQYLKSTANETSKRGHQKFQVKKIDPTHMNIFYRDVDIVEELCVIFHRTASGEEYHTFLVFVFLDKCEQ